MFSEYNDYEIFIGTVSYLDYDVDPITNGNLLIPIMSKRKSFEQEREVRALIWTLQHGKNGSGIENKLKDIHGLYVPLSLSTLIEKVHVAPTAPGWVRELLESIMQRFGLKIPVRQSSLADSPF